MKQQQTYIPKKFQLIDQFTGKTHSFKIEVLYQTSTRQISISDAIATITSKGLNLNNSHLFYLDNQHKLFIHLGLFPFQSQVYMKSQLIFDNTIKIRYRHLALQQQTSIDINTNRNGRQNNIKKVKKVKQRTIIQARDNVYRWRHLYQQVDQKGKRLYNLESAAVKVGLAKKTLDDYYYQIRLGEQFNFPFQQYLYEKIGHLRRFNRKNADRIMISECGASSVIQEDIDCYLASSSEDERR